MKPTLFILAAGMGSRYGTLKQLDGLGPNGETIMDYSVYDALRAGFGKVVFVIRRSFEKEFREQIVSKYSSQVPVELVFQEIENVPSGSHYNEKREKPWGTNHAVLMGKGVIKEPFAIINADDFYGQQSYEILSEFLQSMSGKQNTYCMVGYRLGNTLSERGAVSRGVCSKDENSYLTSIVERTRIEQTNGVIQYVDDKGFSYNLSEQLPVSMNMWGFTPDYFEYSESAFREFLNENGDSLKSEFYIPTVINNLLQEKQITCKVLDTPAKWFGVTYAEDRSVVVLKINELISKGLYPKKLWK